MAVNAISSIGEPPSDQSECECRSPAQLRPELVAALHQRPERRLELGQPLRQHAVHRVGDDGRGARSDARQVGERAGVRTGCDLVVPAAAGSPRPRCGRPGSGGSPHGPAPSGTRSGAAPRPVPRRTSRPASPPSPSNFLLSTPGGRTTPTSSLVSGPYAVRSPRVVHSQGRSEATCPPLLHRCSPVVPRVVHKLSTGDTPVALTPSTGRHLAWTQMGLPVIDTTFARGRQASRN